MKRVAARTLFEKIWSRHAIATLGDRALLFVDRNDANPVTKPRE